MLISVAGKRVAPTLAPACAALPPEGALAPWGGPAALAITPTVFAAMEQVGSALHRYHRKPYPTLRCLMRGFTLLELLVVIAIIAIASAGATLALRDSSTTALEREAQRVAAILEAGRSQSRTTGLAVRWLPDAEGFTLATHGAQGDAPLQAWLTPGTSAQTDSSRTFVLLGPEPIIPAQSITLSLDNRTVKIGSDGLRPFRVEGANP